MLFRSVLERPLEMSTEELAVQICERIYGSETGEYVPRLLLLPVETPEALASWLSKRRGSLVEVRVPQRGDKRALMDTVQANATQTLQRAKLSRATDITARSRALAELQDALELAEAPLRIECIDVSTLQGTNTVASLVVFEDGLPRKSDYRSFIITTPRADDTAAVQDRKSTRLNSSHT